MEWGRTRNRAPSCARPLFKTASNDWDNLWKKKYFLIIRHYALGFVCWLPARKESVMILPALSTSCQASWRPAWKQTPDLRLVWKHTKYINKVCHTHKFFFYSEQKLTKTTSSAKTISKEKILGWSSKLHTHTDRETTTHTTSCQQLPWLETVTVGLLEH